MSLFTCVQMTHHISLKNSWQGLQRYLGPHLNQKFTQEIMSLQSGKSSNFKNFKTHNLGVLGQNHIWVQPPWPSIENTIKGKVMVSPKFRLWWVLWVCVCPWLIYAPKVFQLCTNHLVVWFVQVHMNNWFIYHSS